jgi:hypothetical protein
VVLASQDAEATPEDRRRAFDDLRAAASCPYVDLDARLFDVLARDVAEPRSEVFVGEIAALLAVVVDEQEGQPFAARVLAQAAIDIVNQESSGTRAARTALLRAVASFLMHDRVARMALPRTEAGHR